MKAIILLVLYSSTIISQPTWNYLTSEAFKTRYVLAADYFKKKSCGLVVEIGGYKTPISDFLTKNIKSIVIDPLAPIRFDDRAKHYQMYWNEFNEQINESDYGILILGMDLYNMDTKAWEKLFNLINKAKVLIIGFPLTWEPSKQQFSKILNSTNKKIKMQIMLDFKNNDFGDLTNSYPPRTERIMYFLE